MLSQEFVQEMKARLLEEKQRLGQELKGLHTHTEMGDGQDENAEEIELDEASQSTMARIEADLAKIEKALGKVDAGTYGVDEEGREISQDRLRALPWADRAL